jgi:hypothetical protein
VLAYAKIFMASAATALNRLGMVMIGASGQRIMITLVLSAGWTKAISIAVQRLARACVQSRRTCCSRPWASTWESPPSVCTEP